jgi:4-amino-4-deoxy-L-arabinose transferase-like glycosyltransferase
VLAPAALVFVAIVLPWHAAVAILDPPYLWKLYIDQQWNRAVEAGARLHARPLLFYVPVLLGGFFPWSAFLPASIRGTLWPARRGPEETFCALWAGVVLVVLSLAEGKIPSYIVVAFPPLALLTARHLGRLAAGELHGPELFLTWAGMWAVVASLVVAPAVVIGIGHYLYDAALGPTSLWSLLLLLPAIGAALLLRRDRLGDAVLLCGVANVVMLLVFFGLAAPALMEVHSDAALARTFSAANPPGSTAPLVAYGLRSPSTSFYARRPLLLRDRRRQLKALLAEHPLVFVVTSPEHVAEIQAVGPFVPWYVGARRVLYASQPPPAANDGGVGYR